MLYGRFISKKKHVLDDDELVSEYAASELSEILAREFAGEEDSDQGEVCERTAV